MKCVSFNRLIDFMTTRLQRRKMLTAIGVAVGAGGLAGIPSSMSVAKQQVLGTESRKGKRRKERNKKLIKKAGRRCKRTSIRLSNSCDNYCFENWGADPNNHFACRNSCLSCMPYYRNCFYRQGNNCVAAFRGSW